MGYCEYTSSTHCDPDIQSDKALSMSKLYVHGLEKLSWSSSLEAVVEMTCFQTELEEAYLGLLVVDL